jgi:hypothetical protein
MRVSLESSLISNTARRQAKTSLQSGWPALKLALTVFEKTLNGVPIPGLKGAVGGILILGNAEEVRMKANNCMC